MNSNSKSSISVVISSHFSEIQTLSGTSMKLHDCEAIEIESVEEVSIGLESVKKALRKCQETNKRFP